MHVYEDGAMLTGRQCAAGRTLAGLTQEALARQAGVNMRTLIDFENGRRAAKDETKQALAAALRAAGVALLARDGVARTAA
jgi:transcriptional regulator with XRE-family HTH domain